MTGDSPVSGAPDDGVSRTRALTFAALAGYRPLELDLLRPASVGPSAERLRPAVVYLHGGGWRQGARDMASPAFRDWNPGLLTYVTAKLVKDALDGKMPTDGEEIAGVPGKISVKGATVIPPLRLEINKDNVDKMTF